MDIQEKQLQHQEALNATSREIRALLRKQQLVKDLSHRQPGPRADVLDTLLSRQQNVELRRSLGKLHPADLAWVLESLPLDERMRLWELVARGDRGAVLIELSDVVRAALVQAMPEEEVTGYLLHMDPTEVADFLDGIPEEARQKLLQRVDQKERQKIQETITFPGHSVGSIMDLEMLTVRDDRTVGDLITLLRRQATVSPAIDRVYVVDPEGRYRGHVPLRDVLFHTPETGVADLVRDDGLRFFTDDDAADAVSVFERYDLVNAAVLNIHNRVVGNINVSAILDYMDERQESLQLKRAGLQEDEELFSPPMQSARNRWLWLGLNLVTAFMASRVISAFESTLTQLIALATLMPIVASVGGNTGNQTVALMVRGLALNRVNRENLPYVITKELRVGLINGALWGMAVALFALVFYGSLALSGVMLAAMTANLLLAALAGVAIPWTLARAGRDPVMGSSVLLTAVTDCMGFFIFLGMAAMVLV